MRNLQASCILPGCRRQTQQTAGDGYSPRYCKHHVEFHRRHGSYWFRSLAAGEVLPFRRAARKWLSSNQSDFRVRKAIQTIAARLDTAGRAENAYSLRGRSAQEKANIAFARLREADTDPVHLLERAIAIAACCAHRGIDDRQREYRYVQVAKSVHRLASGTHKTHSGFPMKSKYPRSEGQVLRIIGQWLDDIAAFATDGREVVESYSHE